MKTKRANSIAWFCAACLLFSAQAFAAKFPSYFKMDGTKITGCDHAALPANLVIPDGVTEIGAYAFYGRTSLVTVTIPASVKTIENNAFEYCDNIKTVQYKGTLAQWCEMDNAWSILNANTITMSDLPDLKTMTALAIPEGVTKIGHCAFYGCSSLESVIIPASVKSFEEGAFGWGDNIKTVQYKGTLAQWCEIVNGSTLVEKAKAITMSDVADLKATTSLVIPEGVTKIGHDAFNGCTSLESVTIPASVTEIGDNAFYGCKALANAELAEGVKKIGRSAFSGCISLENITIPNSVTEIGWTAFWGCASLANVMIPDGVTEIGSSAFWGCTSLVTVSIPASVKIIGLGAFSGCDNIKTAQYRGTLAQWCEIGNDAYLVEKAKAITMSDVADLKAMTALTIPEGVTKIGYLAFYCCKELASVTIPDGVTEIGSSAFWGCKSLETISIPASVKTIGNSAFEYCDNIKTVQYKGTLAQWCEMDNDAFLVWNAKTIATSNVADLKAMTALTIPKGVTSIGSYAFNGCKPLVSMTISDGVTEIGEAAFHGCSSLSAISIPASIKSIRSGAFADCDTIKTVQYKGTLAQWCQMDNDINLVKNAKTITMSDVVDLKAMTALTIPKGVKEIGAIAFAVCTSLKSISIPKSVTKIGWAAFVGCKSLTSVKIPESVTEIDREAFAVCESLASVTIADSVKTIGSDSFMGCTSLISVEIPSSVTIIGQSAFEGCKSLASVKIPESVTEIHYGIFMGCTSLTNIEIPSSVTIIYSGAFDGCTSLAKIVFTGTVAQWSSIDKGDVWHKNVPAKKVICKDGEVDVD